MHIGQKVLFQLFHSELAQLGGIYLNILPSLIKVRNTEMENLSILRFASKTKPYIVKGNIVGDSNNEVVAKICRNKKSLMYELNVMKSIREKIQENDIIPPIIDEGNVRIDESKYFAIMIPFYSKTLADLLPEEAHMGYNAIKTTASHLVKVITTGFCHRDITPMNIYLDANNQAIIGDWGIAVPNNVVVTDASMTLFFASDDYLEVRFKHQPYKYSLNDDLESLFYCMIDVVLPHRKYLPWFRSFEGGINLQFWLTRKAHLGNENRWEDFKSLTVEKLKGKVDDPEQTIKILENLHQHLYVKKIGIWE